jgi:polyhydroxybutyrate depolymerase
VRVPANAREVPAGVASSLTIAALARVASSTVMSLVWGRSGVDVGLLAALMLVACSTAAGDGGETDTDERGSETADVEPSTSTSPTSSDPPASTSSATTTPDDGESDPTSASAESGETTGPEIPPGECEVASLFQPGMSNGITIDVDGVQRSYDLFVPTGYDGTELAPLVLNFHGLLGSPSQQVDFSQFNGAAEAHGMLVAYPAGIDSSFNAGSCCGGAASSGVDDVGFARALVQDMSAKMCVDPRRVYATGMSNGGHMAHRLACEAADVFAATASVTGALRLADCTPSRPISMVDYHGTADTIVGYGEIPGMMEDWAARNGCSAMPETTFDQGDMLCQTWPECDAGVEVTLCTIEGGGHCWPGNGSCIFGHSSTELHASEAIATMFDAQLLP